jgi:ferredoxin
VAVSFTRRQDSRSTSEEMQLIKISVDKLACQNYGQCVLEAPNIFSLNSDDELEYLAEADDDERDNVEAAVDVCPMQAIRIVE